MKLGSAFTGALFVCAVTSASAQQTATSEDKRTQYPPFLTNSYFTVNVGKIGYVFSSRQLEPGYEAESIEIPHVAVRVDLFGHRFTEHLSAQVTYMRPARYVEYRNVNGGGVSGQVSAAYGGLTLVGDMSLHRRLSGYLEGGWGVTSRSGFAIGEAIVLKDAHFGAGLLGGGLVYHATPNVDMMFGATYSPGRRLFSQPSTRLFMTGLRYHMRELPAAKVEENRSGGFAFPANIARLGYTTSLLTYGVNNFFSQKVPIFWGGRVETRRGVTVDFERNVFHTKKVFAFDVGASASSWKSDGKKEVFRTLSVYPLFRFFMARTQPADVYFSYSLAGPTMISDTEIDGREVGARFTFQDFMGVGAYLGKSRRLNAELGIKHYSNGNIFIRNASIKVPLTLTLGVAF